MGALLDGVVNQFRDRGMPEISVIELKADDKKHLYGPKKKAWYRLNEYVSPKTGKVWLSGVFGFKDEWWKVEHEGFEALSDEERQAAKAEWARKEAEYQAKQQLGYRNAASRARQQLQDAARAGGSAYLVRKQVKKPESVRFMQDDKLGWVIIPLLRYDRGEIVGVQKISPQKLADGNDKLYSSGFEKVGAACRLGDEPIDGDLILIAEGYATAATGREATDYAFPVFMALDSGNLPHVARILRAKYPSSPFLFLADDDYLPNKRGDDNHAGEKKAFAASQEVGNAVYVLPVFSTERRVDPADELLPKLTDFNDLHIAEGIEVVCEQIKVAIGLLFPPVVELVPEIDQSSSALPLAGAEPRINPLPAQAEPSGENDSEAWRESLLWSESGLRPIFSNAYEVLRNDPDWVGVIGFDEFSGHVVKLKPPPWPCAEIGRWTDSDSSKGLIWLQQRYRLFLKSSTIVDEAVKTVANDNRFHPVREYLSGLVWDGVERLAFWLSDVYDVEQNDYSAHVGSGWLVSAVARVFSPGCKVDEMVVLEGGQGAGKSTSLSLLFSEKWYLETSENPSGKDFYISLQGKWLVEIGEMNSFTKSEVTQVKMAVSRRDDTFRAPYERNSTSHPRQCVFAGTTNANSYLNDPTGARRFLPLKCGDKVNLDYIRNCRDKLWAEAVASYKSGFKWWEYPRDLAQAEQDKRYVEDVWFDNIVDYLEGRAAFNDYPAGHKGRIMSVTTAEILHHAIKMDIGKRGRPESMRVASILKRLGWSDPKQKADGKRYYHRPEPVPLLAQADGYV